MDNTGFISKPRSFNNDKIPFDPDAPNAEAYSSDFAVIRAMIVLLFCA